MVDETLAIQRLKGLQVPNCTPECVKASLVSGRCYSCTRYEASGSSNEFLGAAPRLYPGGNHVHMPVSVAVSGNRNLGAKDTWWASNREPQRTGPRAPHHFK